MSVEEGPRKRPNLSVQTDVTRHRAQRPTLKSHFNQRGDPVSARLSNVSHGSSSSSRRWHFRDDVERKLSVARKKATPAWGLPVNPRIAHDLGAGFGADKVPSRDSNYILFPTELVPPAASTSTLTSPSDGPIYIGFAVPSTKLSEFKIKDGAETKTEPAAEHTPVTPSIIVTPADDYSPSRYSSTSRYSEASVPPLPANGLLEEQREKFRLLSIGEADGVKKSHFSDATSFDWSSTSGRDTIIPVGESAMSPSPATSTGWWNVVLSPTTAMTAKAAEELAPPAEMVQRTSSPSVTLSLRTVTPNATPRVGQAATNRNTAWTDVLEWDTPLTAVQDDLAVKEVVTHEKQPMEDLATDVKPAASLLAGVRDLRAPEIKRRPFLTARKDSLPTVSGNYSTDLKRKPAPWTVREQKHPVQPLDADRKQPLESAQATQPVVYQAYPYYEAAQFTTTQRHNLLPQLNTPPKLTDLPQQLEKPPKLDDEVEYDSDDFDDHTPILKRAATVGFSAPPRKPVMMSDAAAAGITSPGPPPYSPPPSTLAKMRPIMPPERVFRPIEEVSSPGPISPAILRVESARSYALTPMRDARPVSPARGFRQPAPITLSTIQDPHEVRMRIEAQRQKKEKREACFDRLGNCWRGRKIMGHEIKPGRTRRRKACGFLCLGLIIIAILVIVIVAVTISKKKAQRNFKVVQREITVPGFPTIPIGSFVVPQPPVISQTACTVPADLWTCSGPPGSASLDLIDHPDFNILMQFNPTAPGRRKRSDIVLPPVMPLAEQMFLGSTTDGIMSPNYAGRETPFSLSFVTPTLQKRADSSNVVGSVRNAAPRQPKSSPTDPTILLPTIVMNQPLRLYNEGTSLEHYGLSTTYNRTIYFSNKAISSVESAAGGVRPSQAGTQRNQPGPEVVWADTRLHIQIWTKWNTTLWHSAAADAIAAQSAKNDTLPTNFPYPITIGIDRHGSLNNRSSLFSYDIVNGLYDTGVPGLVREDYSAGGTVIQSADGVFIGGTGGCKCRWTNYSPELSPSYVP